MVEDDRFDIDTATALSVLVHAGRHDGSAGAVAEEATETVVVSHGLMAEPQPLLSCWP